MAFSPDDGGSTAAEGARGRGGPNREDERESGREELTMTMKQSSSQFFAEAMERFTPLAVEYALDIDRAMEKDGKASALAMMMGMMAAVVGTHKNWFGNEKGDRLSEIMLRQFTKIEMED